MEETFIKMHCMHTKVNMFVNEICNMWHWFVFPLSWSLNIVFIWIPLENTWNKDLLTQTSSSTLHCLFKEVSIKYENIVKSWCFTAARIFTTFSCKYLNWIPWIPFSASLPICNFKVSLLSCKFKRAAFKCAFKQVNYKPNFQSVKQNSKLYNCTIVQLYMFVALLGLSCTVAVYELVISSILPQKGLRCY